MAWRNHFSTYAQRQEKAAAEREHREALGLGAGPLDSFDYGQRTPKPDTTLFDAVTERATERERKIFGRAIDFGYGEGFTSRYAGATERHAKIPLTDAEREVVGQIQQSPASEEPDDGFGYGPEFAKRCPSDEQRRRDAMPKPTAVKGSLLYGGGDDAA